MSEPSTTTFVLTGAAAAALGPALGPWVLVVFGAVAGSLLAMGATPMPTRLDAARFILVGVIVATSLTGAVAWAGEKYLGLPSSVSVMPVAFALGVGRVALRDTITSIIQAASSWVNRLAGGPK